MLINIIKKSVSNLDTTRSSMGSPIHAPTLYSIIRSYTIPGPNSMLREGGVTLSIVLLLNR
jgi:hypothetical protein